MSPLVREAQPTDAPAIVRLLREHAALAGEASPIAEAYVVHHLAGPESHVLLAEAAGESVGLLAYSVRPDLYHAGPVCLIEELVVRAAWRRRGIGGALMAQLARRLAERGVIEVSVAVMPANTGAVAFYRAHGLTGEALALERHMDG
jgi:ribosomal protein S18 acetylase RimI-like enzyme